MTPRKTAPSKTVAKTRLKVPSTRVDKAPGKALALRAEQPMTTTYGTGSGTITVTVTHPIPHFTGTVTVLGTVVLPFTDGTASVTVPGYALGAIGAAGFEVTIGTQSPAPPYDANLDTLVSPIVANAASATRAVLGAAYAAVGDLRAFKIYSPENYGAVGDGATDDTAALTAALNAANTAHGTLVLRANYLTIAALPALTSSTSVLGEFGSTITVAASAAVGVFDLTNAIKATIRGVSIVGNGSAKTADKVAVLSTGGSVGCSVIDVHISDWHGTAISIAGSDRTTIRGCYITGTTRTSTNNGHGILLTTNGAVSSTAGLIDGCHTRNTIGSGITTAGDWNHPDWRTGAYAKVTDTTISNCTTYGSGDGAGIFVNSGLRVVVTGCHGNDSVTDYGIGLEYSLASKIVGCTAKGNFGHGFALYASDEDCTITDCTSTGNGTDGFSIDAHPELVAGDTATDRCAIANCTARSNGRYGLYLGKVQGATVTGGSFIGAADTGMYATECVDLNVTGATISGGTLNGVRILKATRAKVGSCKISGTAGAGVSIEGASGQLSTDVTVTGCEISGFPNGVRVADTFSADTFVTGNRIADCTNGVSGNTGAQKVTVTGNRFQTNSTRDIVCAGALEWVVTANTFVDQALTSIDFQVGGAVSANRCTIQDNIFGSATAMRVSVGTGAVAADWFVIRNNTLAGIGAIVYTTMDTTNMGITFEGRGSGSPEGVVYANKGSIFRRSDGGTATSLYVKESGFGNTGWVAK